MCEAQKTVSLGYAFKVLGGVPKRILSNIFVIVHPSGVVMVRLGSKTPTCAYVWFAKVSVVLSVFPSPKFQLKLATTFGDEAVDTEAVNTLLIGMQPLLNKMELDNMGSIIFNSFLSVDLQP